MGDIALRGNKLTKGRVGKFGGGRTNLLEELGRVEAERSNPNRRAEISRVHGELNRGYATGGTVRHIKKGIRALGEAAKKHVTRKDFKTHGKDVPTMAAKGGRIGKAVGGWTLRKPVQKLLEGIGGGSEKNLILLEQEEYLQAYEKLKEVQNRGIKD